MKEEDYILKKVGKENVFRVPEGYFEGFTSELMSRLPEKEPVEEQELNPTLGQRVRPWLYMAAMLVGAALIIRVASDNSSATAGSLATAEMDDDTEMEYINTAVENSMLDDYSLYVYLADSSIE